MTSLQTIAAKHIGLVAWVHLLPLIFGRLLGGIGIGLSDEFSIDTGGRVPLPSTAFSSEFTIDTGGRVPAVASSASLDFIINTRGGAMGYANSAFVTIDTRDNSILGFSARAQTSAGAALAGVSVSVWQNGVALASVATDVRGLVSIGGLFAGYYEIRAQKSGYLTQVRRHVRVPEDVSSGVTFVMSTPPAAPVAEKTSILPAESLVNPPRRPTTWHLRVFAGGSNGNWDPAATMDPAKMTVVMTHGCDSSPAQWALGMARKMSLIPTLTNKVNIVAWDWQLEAAVGLSGVVASLGTVCLYPRQLTSEQGLYLGQALRSTLGSEYDQPIHFMGHSLGTLVNGTAANYIHDDDPNHPVSPRWDWRKTHVTLFDEAGGLPEVQFDWQVYHWADPIPKRVAYVDNYISTFGRLHNRGVDVLLPRKNLTLSFHSYPYEWYQLTIESPWTSDLGFRYSFELAALKNEDAFFPVPNLIPDGSLFRQDLLSSNPLELRGFEKPEGVPPNAVVKLAELELSALYGVGRAGLWIFNKGVQGANYVVDQVSAAGLTVARKTGQVSLSVVETLVDGVGNTLNSLDDPSYGVGQTTPAIIAVQGLLQNTQVQSTYSIRADLLTGPLRLGQFADRNALPAGVGDPENVPAYVWLPLTVPADAVAIAFDFRLTGEGASDRVVAGIGSSNLFNVNLEFLEANRWMNSGLLAVTPWAGKEVEFFLGVGGGTSTNANLSVQNIRFIGLPKPILETLRVNGQMVLTWADVVPAVVLEFSPNLAAPDWSPITNTTRYTSQRVFTNAVSSLEGFYRLRALSGTDSVF